MNATVRRSVESGALRRWFASASALLRVVVVLLAASHCLPVFACSASNTQAQAVQACQAFLSSAGTGSCTAKDLGPSGDEDLWDEHYQDSNGGYGDWEYCAAPPPTCTSGYMLANGATYDFASGSGQSSYQGCCLSMMLGGPNSGAMVETGQACAGTGQTVSVKPPSETSNPDGSKTYCDTNSGKCVTYNPNGSGPASSSSVNGSTDSTSQTNVPASSSSSTSVSSTSGTTSGTGSGGTGSGSYTGTTTTTTTTDNPASSSSTSTKCDTGVCDVGNADGNIGTLYTASTDTPSSVFASFRAQVSSSPIATATSAFFSVSASGSCPVYTAPATTYWPAGLTFDYYCRQEFLPYFTLAGFVVLAAAAAYAFKIAVY